MRTRRTGSLIIWLGGVRGGDGSGLCLRRVVLLPVLSAAWAAPGLGDAGRSVRLGGLADGRFAAAVGDGGGDGSACWGGAGVGEPAGRGGPGFVRVPGDVRRPGRQPGPGAAAWAGAAGQVTGGVGASRSGSAPSRGAVGAEPAPAAGVVGPRRGRCFLGRPAYPSGPG